MDNKPYLSWKNVRNELCFSPEQKAEIQLEKDIIEATIEGSPIKKRLKILFITKYYFNIVFFYCL